MMTRGYERRRARQRTLGESATGARVVTVGTVLPTQLGAIATSDASTRVHLAPRASLARPACGSK